SSSQINLSWTAPADVGGSAITGYKIERSTDGVTFSTIISNTGSASTAFSDSGLAPSTTYTYRVSAITLVLTSSPSNTSSATTKPLPPATPTGVTATQKTSTEITISWTASDSATWYQVFNSTSSSGPFTKFGGTNRTSLVIWGLHPSTTYYFEVRAGNLGGTSALSSPPVSATTKPLPPAAPPGVTATTKSSSSM